MGTWIVLLKGINVGGKHIASMKNLATEFESLGLVDVRTYIQSGNFVFRDSKRTAPTLAQEIGTVIENKFGFTSDVFVLKKKELEAAANDNPFRNLMTAENGKTLHLFFLENRPSHFNQDRLEILLDESEDWHLDGKVFYLHAPKGIGRSKVATQMEKILGVTATARNWNTVLALMELAASIGSERK